MISLKLGKLLALTVLIVTLLFSYSGVASAEFDRNSIIGDSVFSDKGTMSAAQIDSFLNKFSHSCISTNRGFSAKQPTGYSYETGYQYGGYVSAGSVIYSAAQAYNLNPQVLIVTLEKEQSLVTGRGNYSGYCNNSDQHKYTAAMGYGCPDSGGTYSYTGISLYRRNGTVRSTTGTTCVNSKDKAGFSQQVIRAAWLLKFGQQRSLGNTDWAIVRGSWDNSDDRQSCYSGPMTRGNHQVCPSGSTIYYDGYRTIDGTKTFMGTGATAALYWYTPHFHGNELFVNFFEKWFGSTIGSDLLRSTSNATVYLVSGDKKYPIPNQATLQALYPLGKVRYVSSSYLSEKTTGPTVKRLIKGEGSSIYFFDAGIKLAFGSCGAVAHYGLSCSDFVQLTDLQLSKFHSGPVMPQVMHTTSDKWFYMLDGAKKETTSKDALTANGISSTAVKLHESSLADLPLGSPIVKNNSAIKSRNTNRRYLYSGGTRFELPSGLRQLTFLNSLYGDGQLDQASIDKLTPTAFGGYMTDGTNRYILNDYGKALVSNPNDISSQYTVVPAGLISAIPNSSDSLGVNKLYKSKGNSTVFRVVARQKAPIAGWNDLILIDSTPQIVEIPKHYIDALSTIRLQFGPTRLIKSSSSSTVYMVDGFQNKRAVGSFSVVRGAGINLPVATVSPSVIEGYSNNVGLADHRIKCGDTFFMATNGGLKSMTSPMRIAYGFLDTEFVEYEAETCAVLRKTGDFNSRYVKTESSRSIYYIEGGQRRPFTSFSSYTSHGGSSSNTVTVESTLLGLVPIGPIL